MPRRARYLLPAGLPRRDEILACCLVLAVLAHLLFAQLTLLFALVLAAITRMTGWRPSWLAVPGAAAVAWAAAVGPRAAAAGFAAGPAAVAAYFAASGRRPGHLLHFGGAFTGMGAWLPRQLPLALLAGAACPARAAGGRQARRRDAGDPGRPHRDQGRRPPRRGRRIRRQDRAVVVGDGRRRRGLRLGRGRRAGRRLPARPRRGAAAQAGTRRGPHLGPRSAAAACRGLRRRRCAAAGVRRRRAGGGRTGGRPGRAGLLRALPPRRCRAAGLAGRGDAEPGRAGRPVSPRLRRLPAGRLRADRRGARRPRGPRAGR